MNPCFGRRSRDKIFLSLANRILRLASATPLPSIRRSPFVVPHMQINSLPGELFIWTNVEHGYEADMNHWYESEHLRERVLIPGFRWARRYCSRQGPRRYLALYRTDALDVFSSPAYQFAFRNQTEWSQQVFTRMRDTMRRVCSVPHVGGVGTGQGGILLELPPHLSHELQGQLLSNLGKLAGVAGFHWLEPVAELSTPLPGGDFGNLSPMVFADILQPEAHAQVVSMLRNLDLEACTQVHAFDFMREVRAADLVQAPH